MSGKNNKFQAGQFFIVVLDKVNGVGIDIWFNKLIYGLQEGELLGQNYEIEDWEWEEIKNDNLN